jgi:hypothetical protein
MHDREKLKITKADKQEKECHVFDCFSDNSIRHKVHDIIIQVRIYEMGWPLNALITLSLFMLLNNVLKYNINLVLISALV